jgi:hypothetical protein
VLLVDRILGYFARKPENGAPICAHRRTGSPVFGGLTMKAIRWRVVGAALLLVALSPAGMAGGGGNGTSNNVRWQTIIGIIQAGNVVGGIGGGGQPWSTLGGHAYANLSEGVVDFEVKGLVLAGGNSIGTPDTITQVKGTLICGPETTTPTVFDTPLVTLSPQGDAEFDGSFGSSTAGCSANDVAFLIRISAGRWIANGAVRVP